MPTLNQVHVNQPLTNISIAYLQSQTKYIANEVFPNIPVDKRSDLYYEYSKADFFRDEFQPRAPGAPNAEMSYKLSQASYSCKKWGLARVVTDDEMQNEDDPLDAKRDTTMILTQKGAIRKEKDWATNNFTTGIWTGSSTGSDIVPTNKWNTASGDPVLDIGNEIDAMEQKTGYEPNVLVLPKVVFRALQNNEDIKDRIKYTGVPSNTSITAAMLAELFGVERVLVASATNNIAVKKEDGSSTMQYIFGSDQAALFYAAPNPAILVPSAGYTFSWRLFAGNEMGVRIKDYRLEERDGDKVEADMSFDQKVVAPDLGVFFDDVLS
jgi:hypothetical protein